MMISIMMTLLRVLGTIGQGMIAQNFLIAALIITLGIAGICLFFSGTVEQPAITDWNSLPLDMEEKILGNLSLWKLAEISSTSKHFARIFRLKLIKEQKARCDLAIQRFGKQRLSSIADVANRFLNGQPLDSGSGRKGGQSWWMSEDGKLHAGEPSWRRTLQDASLKVGDVGVALDMYTDMLSINVLLHSGSSLAISVFPIGIKRCLFLLEPSGDDDMDGVALVQALLSRELGEQDNLDSFVFMTWGDDKEGFTYAGLQTQVAPLQPLALVFKLPKQDSGK